MDEDRLSARDELSRRKLCDKRESFDKLARDIEKLLNRASPNLPAKIRDTELRFHLINTLPEKIAFQLKLLPKENYHRTISKTRELLSIFSRAEASEPVKEVGTVTKDT